MGGSTHTSIKLFSAAMPVGYDDKLQQSNGDVGLVMLQQHRG